MNFRKTIAAVLFFPALVIALGTLAGCRTVASKDRPKVMGEAANETPQDVTSALKAVTYGVSGKEMSQEEMRGLANDLRKNKDTQSAVESVAGALSGQPLKVRYCPVDGKRFSAKIKICPEHHVELKDLD